MKQRTRGYKNDPTDQKPTELADTNNIVKSCLYNDDRYLKSMAMNIKVMDENSGDYVLPGYQGNLPSKMKV